MFPVRDHFSQNYKMHTWSGFRMTSHIYIYVILHILYILFFLITFALSLLHVIIFVLPLLYNNNSNNNNSNKIIITLIQGPIYKAS